MKTIPVRKLSHPPEEPDLVGNFGIRRIEEIVKGHEMVQPLHRHDFYFVLFVASGKGQHVIDFESYEVGRQSVFFMRPGQVHELILEEGSTGYLIQFTLDFHALKESSSIQLLRKAGKTNHYKIHSEGFSKMDSILAAMLEEFRMKAEGFLEVLKAQLAIFLTLLLRFQPHQKDAPVAKIASYKQERLDAFLALLETNYANHKSVPAYSEMLNLSAYQLNAITKTYVGKTGSQIIQEYGILESKRYLLATTNQVKEIAYLLGYDDVAYFIRFFKEHTGYSPEAFRKKFK